MSIESPTPLLDYVYRWEESRPHEIYLSQPMGDGSVRDITWSEALREARTMATYLRSLGLPKGSRIAILSKNCAHFILSDLAIWLAGHVSVALFPTIRPEQARYILEHSDAKLLFVGKLDDWETLQKGVPDSLPCIAYPLSPPNDYPKWNEIVATHEPFGSRFLPDPEELALLIYTSGSTGTPKGVAHNFKNMAACYEGFNDILKIGPGDRLLSYLPLAHVFERAAVAGCSLRYGCRVFFADSLDTFREDMQRARPTIFQSVPRLWLKFQLGVFQKMPERRLSLLLKIPIINSFVRKKVLAGLGLDATRIAVSGSAPIPPALIDWYRDLGLELLEGYAMSENFSYSHFSLPKKSRVGYVGHPLPGVEHRISESGEIEVRSPSDMVEYFKDPELTKQAFTKDRFLKTGDRGEIDEAGRLKITGRTKEIFKTSKGKFVAPAPIENRVNANALIESSCVAGSSRPQPYALLILSEDARREVGDPSKRPWFERELQSLLEEVNAEIEHHERLQCLVVSRDEWSPENGLLTPTLKLKRSAIEERYAGELDDWYASDRDIIWQK